MIRKMIVLIMGAVTLLSCNGKFAHVPTNAPSAHTEKSTCVGTETLINVTADINIWGSVSDLTETCVPEAMIPHLRYSFTIDDTGQKVTIGVPKYVNMIWASKYDEPSTENDLRFQCAFDDKGKMPFNFCEVEGIKFIVNYYPD